MLSTDCAHRSAVRAEDVEPGGFQRSNSRQSIKMAFEENDLKLSPQELRERVNWCVYSQFADHFGVPAAVLVNSLVRLYIEAAL